MTSFNEFIIGIMGMWNKFWKMMKKFFGSLTTWIMLMTTVFTLLAVWYIPARYKDVVEKSNVYIDINFSQITFTSELPVWFKIDSATKFKNDSIDQPSKDSARMYTNRALEHGDIMELCSLVSDTCSLQPMYIDAIGRLAYKSNNDTTNLKDLICLTLCFVILGCSARTLYDFIGRTCYKKEQDMKVWWPWYFFRPIICAPIAALLIVSVRTSFFSNLFVSKDLNSYLVVSFVAGFAIMEFLTMLRRLSKSLFDATENNTSNANPPAPNNQ